MARLFVAVWLPDEVIATIERALGELHPELARELRWIPPGRWHITLRFLGEADATNAAIRLAGVTLPAVRARLGPALALLGRDVVHVPVAGLEPLAVAVHAGLSGLGRAPERDGFVGHITLARRRRRGGRAGLAAGLRSIPVDAAFDVSELALVESTLGRDGSRYASVARWPTSAAT